MEYLLGNTPNEPSKFIKRNWVEIINDSRRTYEPSNQIRFKTLMLKSSLCDYTDAYILVSDTITITGGPNEANDDGR